MKALTICQPYAHLIIGAEKRVENRTWPTRYRGPLLIHAGKSREWLKISAPDESFAPYDTSSGRNLDEMVFGAVVGSATLIDCVTIREIDSASLDEQYPWIRSHRHATGPWCWVLDDVVRLTTPVPWRGAQGLFDIPWPQPQQVTHSGVVA